MKKIITITEENESFSMKSEGFDGEGGSGEALAILMIAIKNLIRATVEPEDEKEAIDTIVSNFKEIFNDE